MTIEEMKKLDVGDIVLHVEKQIPMIVAQTEPQVILVRSCLIERLCDWEILSKANHPNE